jgi:predicted Rossmann fold flavoprotein
MDASAEKHQAVIVGGGAAGFFAAIACAETDPSRPVAVLEHSSQFLAKLKSSGGGRCNVTHACFEPASLVRHYPRGARALRGAFSRFQPKDTLEWFEAHGMPLKTEADGRVFPVTEQSQTIVDGLLQAARQAGVALELNVEIESIEREGGVYRLRLPGNKTRSAERLILATGSNPRAWEWARSLGHEIVSPVPSLFTFTLSDARLQGLAGVSVSTARLELEGTAFSETGPLLITHQGLSGPVVLRLSAWAARDLHERAYQAKLKISWVPDLMEEGVRAALEVYRRAHGQRATPGSGPFELPRRLWEKLAAQAGIVAGAHWSEVSNDRLKTLARELCAGHYTISGKNPFKEEFVACGGVKLDEIDFRTMESKKCPGLYFAGEVLDIDGLTGGFNFQSAWTTGWIAGRSAGHP